MANPEHLAILRQGVEVWNNWIQLTREEHWQQHSGSYASKTKVKPDLNGAGLRKATLINVDLNEVLLNGADLHGANLSRARLIRSSLRSADLSADLNNANLRGADLTGANLTSAYVVGATLREADLSGANLWGANLRDADLRGANLQCANMTQARFEETIFGGTNLKGVKGFESCTHIAPSTIDHRTLYMSGPLPPAFLRGCGLPDQLIDYIPSLLTTPIQFYSCFISYSTRDEQFAERLYADLQNNGVRCWYAPHNIQAGKKIHEQIDQAIRVYDRLLLIRSDASMNSEWVKTEIANVRQREVREKRQMLFPISLVPFNQIKDWKAFDADTGKDSDREIREYFIPDFSNWKEHDSYQQAFERLLRDLKAEGKS